MKNKKLLLIVLIMVLIVSIGKETYALFTGEVSSVVQNYSTGTLKLSYSNSVINLNNTYPMSDSDGMNTGSGIITITNTGTLAYKFDVKIDVSSNSTLSNDLIKVSIDEQNPAFLSRDSNIIIRDIILNPGSSRSFSLKLWIDNSASSSQVLGKKFIGNLTSSGIAVKNIDDSVGTVLDGSLYSYIKRNVNTTTQIDFSKQSIDNQTNGIYLTTNTENNEPVYFYRGDVDNHVLFANFCWRIVRTTETGGVKLLYDGIPSNGECNNTGDATTIGNYALNSNYSSPAYVGYMYGTVYNANLKDITTLSESIVFGNDITYANGTYTLKDTYTLTSPSNWSSEYKTIGNKYHYTCFTSSSTCQKVNYIYIIYSGDEKPYFFELSSGKTHLDILKEMLDNSTNTTNSTAKTTIDTWYQNNMISYTSKLEDTVFCNDRTYDVSTSGWNKDYSNYDTWLYFESKQRLEKYNPSLACPNTNDKFTTSADNGNGKLTYPVGLITADEMAYAGGKVWQINTSYYIYNNATSWVLSPSYFSHWNAFQFGLSSSGDFGSYYFVASSYGLRPSISLKPGTILSGGNGTSTSPYVVE